MYMSRICSIKFDFNKIVKIIAKLDYCFTCLHLYPNLFLMRCLPVYHTHFFAYSLWMYMVKYSRTIQGWHLNTINIPFPTTQITLPFHYVWLCVVFKEAANLIFFVMTGYKFLPTSDNPYLQLSQEDTEDEEEMDEM